VLLAGSSVNADVFSPVGVEHTLVDCLLEEGYDVWLEDWRGSLGRTPQQYALDEAAVIDHPAVIATVAEEAGRHDIKAVVHCLGSSGFMLALAAGGLRRANHFNVTHVVSNAVSLHPLVPPRAVKKIRTFAPVANRILPYMDPQWAQDLPLIDKPQPSDCRAAQVAPAMIPKTTLSRLLVAWVRLTHHECNNDACNFAQFMYGVGPSTLYDESKLTEETARWMERQFAWAPARLYRQLARSMLAGHLVPLQLWDQAQLPTNLFEQGPDKDLDTKITFIVGTRNRTFSPTSQLRTYEWFSAHHENPADQYEFKALEGFGHLDVWLAADQSTVHDVVLQGLER
jgi:pimeloyl-ACP methyl ester carboxylesterase